MQASNSATTPDLPRALQQWRARLGEDAVLTAAAAEAYARDTSPHRQSIAAALVPASRHDVPAIVEIARRHRVPLYPISCGRNWGYGSANPPAAGCVILDLHRLQEISIDEELGLVTLEPGVTQQALYDYLERRGLPFMVPVTGGGPKCSVLGNALERGYGSTPNTDHFGAVMGIEAVLPTGEVYRSPLAELGGDAGEYVYKWGVGPYLDGLFAQGGFGVVTRMTIALVRRAERSGVFLFSVRDDRDLESAVAAVQRVLRTAGSNVGGINLMSDLRVLTMAVSPPRSRMASTGALSSDIVAELSRRIGIGAWSGLCSVFGSREHFGATRRLVKRMLGPHVQDLFFLDNRTVSLVKRAAAVLPRGPGRLGRLGAQVQSKVEFMARRLDLTQGRPSELALPLAYWRSRTDAPTQELDPGRDGCGILWYAPVVPMRPDRVRRYVDLVRRECRTHGLDAPITLTSLSSTAFDSTIPLLFCRDSEVQSTRAQACYRGLFAAGQREGFVPYRVGAQFMPLLVEQPRVCWQLGDRLKRAADPEGILAPGRYARLPDGVARTAGDEVQILTDEVAQ
ncbi:MAG: FAD-binding oxidoreductase [Myxococcales bacterium]|nr:FAD-binding oxidoreductase [Myxococcales bacterium]